jgi:hypothetical protein
MEVSGPLQAPAALYPLYRRMVGHHSPSESEEEKNSLLLPGIDPLFLGCPVRNTDFAKAPVVITLIC